MNNKTKKNNYVTIFHGTTLSKNTIKTEGLKPLNCIKTVEILKDTLNIDNIPNEIKSEILKHCGKEGKQFDRPIFTTTSKVIAKNYAKGNTNLLFCERGENCDFGQGELINKQANKLCTSIEYEKFREKNNPACFTEKNIKPKIVTARVLYNDFDRNSKLLLNKSKRKFGDYETLQQEELRVVKIIKPDNIIDIKEIL